MSCQSVHGVPHTTHTHLKAGRGDAWAGHSKAKGSSSSFLNLIMSDSCESFGLADPRGSIIKYFNVPYSQAGIGAPCAGQSRENIVFELSVN